MYTFTYMYTYTYIYRYKCIQSGRKSYVGDPNRRYYLLKKKEDYKLHNYSMHRIRENACP